MHWADGAGKKGALLSGDLLQVTADRKFVSFMWSYPNFIPLGGDAVEAIAARLAPWSYDDLWRVLGSRHRGGRQTRHRNVGRAPCRDFVQRGAP